jgi:adenylate kinase
MYLILLGAPGVGKGTQSKMLEEKFGMVQLSTGDILRSEIAMGTDLGKLAATYMEDGGLVPDDIIVNMISKYLDDRDLILDGFPRTLEQAEALALILEKQNKKLNVVLNITLDDQLIVDRLCGRLICRSCGTSFNTKFAKPRVEGVCDVCSGELYQRPDDKAESIKNRLELYHSKTKPLINFYTKKGKLIMIDGNKNSSEVFENLVEVITKEIK